MLVYMQKEAKLTIKGNLKKWLFLLFNHFKCIKIITLYYVTTPHITLK